MAKIETKKATKTVKPIATNDDKDREAAKTCDLGLVDFRILRYLRKAGASSYREIADGAGVSYNPLTKVLRKDHEGSLGNRGLVKELEEEVGNRNILKFDITANGRKKIEKVK